MARGGLFGRSFGGLFGSRRTRMLAVAVATVAVVATALATALWTGVLHRPYPSRSELAVRGVDVSNHQGAVDWARVRAAGFSFAYIKASEGRTFTDPDYAGFAAGARRAGLRVGPYHFFTLCSPGADQAARFIEASGGPVTGDLPPVVDLEFGGNCTQHPSAAQFDREYAAFDKAVTTAFGRPPILYVTGDFAGRYLDGAAARRAPQAERRRWVRDLLGRPSGGCERWAFWQYGDRGRVDGIAGPVDLDAYCGDQPSFATLTS
jgi:lysozyme